MKIVMIVVILFLMNAFFIISNENLALKHTENIDEFISIYIEWFYNTKDNVSAITGEIISLDWLPQT